MESLLDRRRASLALIGAAGLALGLGSYGRRRVASGGRELRLWVADAGAGGGLLGLDAALRPCFQRTLPGIEAIAAGPGKHLWALGGEALRLFSGDGERLLELGLQTSTSVLHGLPGGHALLHASTGRLLHANPSGRLRQVGDAPPAARLAVAAGRVLVAAGGGELRLLDTGARPALVALRRVPDTPQAVAAVDEGASGWWLLASSQVGAMGPPRSRLCLLGPDLEMRRGISVPAGATRLCATARGGWLLDSAAGVLRHYDRRVQETSRFEVPALARGARFLRDLGSGVLLGTAGALLVVEGPGPHASQGGFGELVGAVPVLPRHRGR